MSIPFEIRPVELKEKLDKEEKFLLLDVREPEEFAIANIGGTLIPLNELPSRLQELPQEEEIVVLCHHGVRSAHAVVFLRERGYENVRNLSGGIEAWSLGVDPRIQRY